MRLHWVYNCPKSSRTTTVYVADSDLGDDGDLTRFRRFWVRPGICRKKILISFLQLRPPPRRIKMRCNLGGANEAERNNHRRVGNGSGRFTGRLSELQPARRQKQKGNGQERRFHPECR